MKKTTQMTAIPMLATVLAGCGGPNEYRPAEGMSAADIFSNACSACHGEKGNGKLGFLLRIAGTESSAEEIVDIIGSGGYIMPSFPNVSDAQRKLIAAYVKALP